MSYILSAVWAVSLDSLSLVLARMKVSALIKFITLGSLLGASNVQAECPDYTSYSQQPQGNPSAGPLKLPYMRPSPECRTFNSTAVEVRSLACCVFRSWANLCTGLQKVITDMKSRIRDPDLARLFENTFPNTLGR
jgi:uncharacterized protein